MDAERIVSARFVRRRLIVMVVATVAAAPIIILGGDFNAREVLGGLIAAAVLVPIVAGAADFIARRVLLAPVFAAIRSGTGDLDAMARGLTAAVWWMFPVWTASFLINVIGPVAIGNAFAGMPLATNFGIGTVAALLGSLVYFSILGLAFEEYACALVRIAAHRQGRRPPEQHIVYGGIGHRIALNLIAVVLYLVGAFAIDGMHTLTALGAGRIDAAGAMRQATIELAAIGTIALLYGMIAARFLSGMLWPVRKAARALQHVGEGNLDALGDLEDVPYLPHEAGVVVSALGAAEASLRASAAAARRLADGDLTTRAAVRGDGDFLGLALDALFGSVRGMVGDARSAASALGAGSTRVDANAERLRGLADGIATELQAASSSVARLERAVMDTGTASAEVAGAVGEVRGAVEGLDDTVRTAAAALAQLTQTVERGGAVVGASSELARGTSEVAAEAARAIARTVAAGERAVTALTTTRAGIEALDEASQRIGAITETMDEIAGQTNLLALNAAIEAARAGEHGRGFAVVADEIRKLATRASDANAEIAALVRDVQGRTAQAVAATRDGEAATQAARDGAAEGARSLAAIERDATETAQRLADVASSYRDQVAATTALERATAAVQTESQRGRAVAERLSGLADTLARASAEGAGAVSETRDRSATLVGQGNDVARGAAELAALTPALREAATRLGAAVARFRDDAIESSPALQLGGTRREDLIA